MREKDVQYVEAAVARAKRKNPSISTSIFDFVRTSCFSDFLLMRQEADREEWLRFVMRFQQITGPVMAKGLEDTAFYIFNRLVSLNEVGGMPDRFGTTLETFHGQNLERAKTFPHAMVPRLPMIRNGAKMCGPGSTRCRRYRRLAEKPGEMEPDQQEEKSRRRWAGSAGPQRGISPLPDPGRSLAQPGRSTGEGWVRFRERIKGYMIKALREAKTNSSWINPNPGYEEAVGIFIDTLLADQGENEFLPRVSPAPEKYRPVWPISIHFPRQYSKIACPGVPDFYQGTELWELSLVDPDNRRPVDYRRRIQALSDLKVREAKIGPAALIQELLSEWETGEIKLYLIHRALSCRRANSMLFKHGEYLPLEAGGDRARNVCAFLRHSRGVRVVAVVPRFMASLAPEPDRVPSGAEVWRDPSCRCRGRMPHDSAMPSPGKP